MTKRLIGTLLLSAALCLPVGAQAAEASTAVAPSIDALVAKMQSFYETSRGFDTRFRQSFVQGGMPSRFAGAGAEGRMRFRKPEGSSEPMMRWDYDDGRILLLVGGKSWTYDPDTKQATEYRVDGVELSAAVTFLWGKGRIADEFAVSRATRDDLSKEGVALELTPKKAGQGFGAVFLVVDPQSGAVRQSVVVQTNGSENRITFVDSKLDSRSDAAAFDPNKIFPEGTVRIKAAIPGQ